jgi:acetaldehyde dehydrogenase/alcohol dehydrogenase
LTSASGIDALTHALEAYVSVLASEYTNGLALEAIRLIFKYLPAAYSEGTTNIKAREKMAHAATIAGMAFANAFLGICHSLAHKLGATHHVPHGVANGMLISEVVRFNAVDNPRKQAAFPQYKYPNAKWRYARIADYLQLGGTTEEEKIELLIAAIEDLKVKVGIPASIKEYGIARERFFATLDDMSEQAFDDQCTGANPRYPLISELKQLYINAYEGKKPQAVKAPVAEAVEETVEA